LKLLQKIEPKKLFLIDSLGALLSAIVLGLVLVRFIPIFGMPANVLLPLSYIALGFSIFSMICFLSKSEKWRPLMKIIGVANLTYCCITIGALIYLKDNITVFGYLYFVPEIVIIAGLSFLEIKIATNS
jgi:hypothetical protein